MSILTHPIVQAALLGLLSAAVVDFQAFRAWKSFNEIKQYSWGLALFRWVQGAALGILSAYVFQGVA